MNSHTSIVSLAAGPAVMACPHTSAPGASRSTALTSVLAVLCGLLVALAVATLAISTGDDEPLPGALAAHHQRFVEHGDGATLPAGPGRVTQDLAARYLTSLSPELRQHISDQVREEQRQGVTPAGTRAFVMRRLALYEAALQNPQASDFASRTH
jgi:hypothetical protein